jgi:hypothetical protein
MLECLGQLEIESYCFADYITKTRSKMHHRCIIRKRGYLAHPQWKLQKKVACSHRLESLDPRHTILHAKCKEIPREEIPDEEIPAIHSHVGA